MVRETVGLMQEADGGVSWVKVVEVVVGRYACNFWEIELWERRSGAKSR